MSAPWVASLTGLFAAAPGHDDEQSPHEVDEVYVVVAGRAVLVGGDRTPVETGSVAHVPPHVPHQFLDVTEDLRVRRGLRITRTRLTSTVAVMRAAHSRSADHR